jgi:hypothetical protein
VVASPSPSSRTLARIGVQRVIHGELQSQSLAVGHIEPGEPLRDRTQGPTLWCDVCLSVDSRRTNDVADSIQDRIGHLEMIEHHLESTSMVVVTQLHLWPSRRGKRRGARTFGCREQFHFRHEEELGVRIDPIF